MISVKVILALSIVAIYLSRVEAGGNSMTSLPCVPVSCPPGSRPALGSRPTTGPTERLVAPLCECTPVECSPMPYGCAPYEKWDNIQCRCVKM